jgi:site-specific DNA-methyltransferase (adenine-specific)
MNNMTQSNRFFEALNIDVNNSKLLRDFSKKTNIPLKKLKYYDDNNILPTGSDLESIIATAQTSEMYLRIAMGHIDRSTLHKLQSSAKNICNLFENTSKKVKVTPDLFQPDFETTLGKLYKKDCITFLKTIEDDSIDMVFADPPFNLSKLYPSEVDDNLKSETYLSWCEDWLYECARVLKPGGSLFVWNLPKWNSSLTTFLNGYLTFRHWIAADIKYSLPIQGRLYPSHYSLIYYTKADKPKTFHPDRLAMQVCPKCYGDLKDYGGYKDKMNPLGVNLSDIWYDIPPVRHAKYKRREGSNELSLKLLDRIIELSTNEGDVILDPFGGSGTTYMAAEIKGRKWIGSEIGPLDVIIERFNLINDEREILSSYRDNLNSLFPDKIKNKRKKLGLWTCDTFNKKEQEA